MKKIKKGGFIACANFPIAMDLPLSCFARSALEAAYPFNTDKMCLIDT